MSAGRFAGRGVRVDFSEIMGMLEEQVVGFVPSLIGALLILLVGWIVAVVLRAVVRKVTGLIGLNERLSASAESEIDIEGGLSKAVYYIALLFALVLFLDALELRFAAEPLQRLIDRFLGALPRLVFGGVLLGVAVLIATIVRAVARAALGATSLDERLQQQAGMQPMSQNLARVLYWLVILLFLPAVLGALQISGLLDPVRGMVEELLAIVPNVIAAAVIAVVGWFVARIVRDLVGNLLSAAGADRLGESAGLRGTLTLSRLVALVVYVLILLPALIAALQALQIEAITEPATAMLHTVMGAIPNVFAAAVILTIAYLVARTAAGLVSELLAGAGFDRLPERIGMGALFGETAPSALVGRLLVFFTMLFASVEAANRLGFEQVSSIVTTFIGFGGDILLGSVIIAVGFWLSNLAYTAIDRVSTGAVVANVARFAILGLVLAMGLRAMGLADDIVNLAFGLTLGSVAVALALAFGLGGREAAGRMADRWVNRAGGE